MKKAKAHNRIRRRTERITLPIFPLRAIGFSMKKAMYIKARYANRIELEYDLHRPPNNFHEPNHLIPFCLLWSVLKVQPVHRRKILVPDKVKSSFFDKNRLYFLRSRLFIPSCFVHFPDATYPVPLIPFRIRKRA